MDVEDWFHILALPTAPNLDTWSSLPGRVDRNFRRMLDLFDEYGVSVTCFFLGWVAERYPDLVREASGRGHEIASHGFAHVLTYEMTPDAFRRDIEKTKLLLEEITGDAVLGYRSPGFSATGDTPWFFEQLAAAGYRYDSSVFPARRAHGGLDGADLAPHQVAVSGGEVTEFPISVAKVLGRRVCFFGGGYLRLFPYSLTERMGRRVLAEGRPLVFYVHPREIDPSHPRLEMGPLRRFKSYVNLSTTEDKIRKILRDFEVTTFERYLAEHSNSEPSS